MGEITLAKKIIQESNIDTRLSQKYSRTSSDEEEIQCLKEDPIKTIAKVLEEDSATELSEAWMIDDVGTMNSECDEDNEPLQADKKDRKISSSKFIKPQELLEKESMNHLSEAWMIDDVGKIDSESKKENEALPAGKKERVNTEKVNDLSEASMIDDVGAMNSESEDENEGSVKSKVCSSNIDAIKNEKEVPQAKTTDLSEAWMIDDVGTIESESEEENISSPEDKKSTDKKDISENKRKIKEDTLSNNVSTIDPESKKKKKKKKKS